MMKTFIITLLTLNILIGCNHENKGFQTNKNFLSIKVNDVLVTSKWKINPELNPDIFKAECKEKKNIVTFSDGIKSVNHQIEIGDTINFNVILNKKHIASTQIIGIKPNVNFTSEYIKENKGKVNVEIPEVSELVNILVALHKDAEKDKNMTNSSTDYFKRVKKYFQPYTKHSVIDTIQKYIHSLQYIKSFKDSMFSNDSYKYYYALKMNACAYSFNDKDQIVNNGIILQMAKGWNSFDPMKDISLITDFAQKSNFRAFYNQNKTYYDSLLVNYKQLNPIHKMQQWLDKKFNFTYGNYSIYFSPLVYGAHSTQKFNANNFNQTFMFICPAEYSDNYSKIMNELLESRVVFTEIDHNYVNPVSDKYLKQINEVFTHREIWAKGEITNSYNNPYAIFNEYMTFAVYSLYLLDNYEKNEVMNFLPKMENQMELRRGFIKFSAFNRELIRKQKENKNYTIDELYLNMLDWASNI